MCMPRERPPFSFSALNFRSGAYFHKITKNPLWSITILHFFCRSGDHHFQNFFNFNPFIAAHGRLTAAAAAPRGYISGRSECQPDASYKVSSGDPHFYARAIPEPPIFHFAAAHTYQNLGWGGGGALSKLSSIRSPAFSRSSRSGAPHFSFCRGTYLPKFGVGGGAALQIENAHWSAMTYLLSFGVL